MGALLRLLGGALLMKAGSAIGNKLRGGAREQPSPERTDPGGAPKRPAHVAKQMADSSLASTFRDLKAGPRARPVDLEQYDAAALRRKLGTPNPSPEQIQTEQQGIESRNEAKVEKEKERFKKSLKKLTGGFLKVGIAAGLMFHAFQRLTEAMNKLDLEKLRMFSPQIAQAAARRDVFDIRQKAQFGQLTGGTTSSLNDKLMELDKKRLPYQGAAKNLTNIGGEWAADIKIKFYEALEEIGIRGIAADINKMANEGDEKEGKANLLGIIKQLERGASIYPGERAINMRPNERAGGRISGGDFP